MSKKTFLQVLSCLISIVIILCSVAAMPSIFAEGSSREVDSKATISDNIDYSEGKFPVFDGYHTIVFDAISEWEGASVYAWSSVTGDYNASWPGVSMDFIGVTADNFNRFVAYIPVDFDTCVINNNGNMPNSMTVDYYLYKHTGIYMDKQDENNGGSWLIGEFGIDVYDGNESDITKPATEDENNKIDEILVYISVDKEYSENGKYLRHIITAEAVGGEEPYEYSFIINGDMHSYCFSPSYENTANVTFENFGYYSLEVSVFDSCGKYTTVITSAYIDTSNMPTEPTASPEDSDYYTLYFINDEGWKNVYAYTWCSGEDYKQPLGQWPGTSCEEYDSGIWYIEVHKDFDYIIFNNNGRQSTILPNPGDTNVARFVSVIDDNTSEYEWVYPVVTEEETTDTTDPAEEITTDTNFTDPTEATSDEKPDNPGVVPDDSDKTDPTEASSSAFATEPEENTTTAPATNDETKPATEDESKPATEDESTAPTGPVDKGVLGDVTGDGKVNIKDATAIQKHVAKLDTGLPIEKPVA